jgi:ribulose-phosphate 3-epimerase
MMDFKLSASVSCMDLCNLERDIIEVEKSDIEFLHFDVVDGEFNRCIILGSPTLSAIRKKTRLPIEVHIAAYKPERFIEQFVAEGADYIAVHYEAMDQPHKVFELIRSLGATPVLAFRAETAPKSDFLALASQVAWILKLTVNPGFSGQKIQPASLEHIRMMRQTISKAGLDIGIQADGNMHLPTVPEAARAGANIFTGGTSGLFCGSNSVQENAENLLASAKAGAL